MIRKFFLVFGLFLPMVLFAGHRHKVASLPYGNFDRSAKPLIILDPGHGGLDLGTRSSSPYCEEKRINLLTAYFTKKYLEQLGYRVRLTRSRDYFVPLKTRVYMANTCNADIFVSIHFNSCPNPLAQGIEILYNQTDSSYKRRQASKRLARTILFYTTRRANAPARKIKDGNLCVIRETEMPAILFEGGFMSNAQERLLLTKRSHLELLAKGLAEGIHRFFQN